MRNEACGDSHDCGILTGFRQSLSCNLLDIRLGEKKNTAKTPFVRSALVIPTMVVLVFQFVIVQTLLAETDSTNRLARTSIYMNITTYQYLLKSRSIRHTCIYHTLDDRQESNSFPLQLTANCGP